MRLSLDKIEKLVANFSRLRERLDSLIDRMRAFARILIEEEDAVRVSNINLIESIVQRKEQLGQQVASDVKAIRSDVKEVRMIVSAGENPGYEPNDLSEFIALASNIKSDLKNSDFSAQVLMHLLEKTCESSNQLIKLRVELQPKIEANSYLVRKLLAHHQETYRFWQSLIVEAESVYGAMGKTKTAKTQSILEVKT